MEPKKKKHGCLTAILVVVALILIGTAVGKVSDAKAKRDRERSYITVTWPTNELVMQLPKPENLYGEITRETEGSFEVLIAKETKADYTKYVEACMSAGFSVDYTKATDYFWANNENGYSLRVSYDEDYKEMSIEITAPSKKAESTALQEEEAESKAEEETPAATEEPLATEEPAAESEAEKTASGIRPEFKESVDSYEEFMNEYVDFMKKYEDSDGSNAQMLLDYASFLAKYSDMAEKFDKLGDEDMSSEESTYYLQTQSRVLAKLSEVA